MSLVSLHLAKEEIDFAQVHLSKGPTADSRHFKRHGHFVYDSLFYPGRSCPHCIGAGGYPGGYCEFQSRSWSGRSLPHTVGTLSLQGAVPLGFGVFLCYEESCELGARDENTDLYSPTPEKFS